MDRVILARDEIAYMINLLDQPIPVFGLLCDQLAECATNTEKE